jgi:endonuclease-3 related protein
MPVNPHIVYERLFACYGPQNWWPGQTPFEIIVGAVLTQNTAWGNVRRAIANLREAELLTLEALHGAEPDTVRTLITPSGFYNVKYRRLRHLLDYLMAQSGTWDRLCTAPVETVRSELLGVHGVGPETADSILLYAFERPTFVVDAYTRRLFARLGEGWLGDASYEAVRAFFLERLPSDRALYNEYHALIVTHGKLRCRKRPLCDRCPLEDDCLHLAGAQAPSHQSAARNPGSVASYSGQIRRE